MMQQIIHYGLHFIAPLFIALLPNLGVPLFFELPANIGACFKVLWGEVKKPIARTKERITQQPERTAWKIVSDWVEIQLAMIKPEQVELIKYSCHAFLIR